MDTISGFWAGAMSLERGALHRWAVAAGGWAALARTSRDDRVRLGVPPEVAQAWVQAPPLTTRGRAVVIGSPDYPPLLDEDGLRPPVLLVEGSVEVLRAPGVAVVGTRRCTPYGASVAHRVAQALASSGRVVTSGLARGIDTHAHRGCLAAGGRTIAVLGHGLATTSPSSNRELREAIVAGGGAVVSTWPDDVEPARHTFPERNRWIAGLSGATVVVEAPEGSGALITAQRASELDRPTWIATGPLGAATWAGSHRALVEAPLPGARPLLDLGQLAAAGQDPRTPHERWIEDLVAGAPLDALAAQLGCSLVQLLHRITQAEVAGRLVRLPAGWGPGTAVP